MTGIAGGRSRDACARRPCVWILCPGRTATAGGVGRVVDNLARYLPTVAPDVRVRILDTRGSGHIALSPFHFARALATILLGAAYGRIALLHVNVCSHGSTARKLIVVTMAAALRLPVLIHLHGAMFNTFYRSLPSLPRRAIRWMFGRAQRVIVLGAFWQRFVIDELGVLPERVEVIANGVARPVAAPRPSPAEPAHIVFLGRLEARKGVADLLAALASPRLVTHVWSATLAGDGDVDAFAARAQALGLGARVRFPGWVDAAGVERLLASASLLVLPSHAEGLAMAVIEALAHGVAVVTTPVGAIPEFLQDGVSAAFVVPGDTAMLAETMATLLEDPARRDRIAGAGHAVFVRHFDIVSVSRRMHAAYAAVSPAIP